MASVDLDTIHKALRNVPEFDGNPNVLIRFLNLCDQLVISYIDPTPGHEMLNLSLLNGILNKITGHAARILATNGTPTTWENIRNTLKNNFSDQRDESALYTDLSVLTQGSDTPHVFYERVQNLLGTIMTYVQLHDQIGTTIEAKRTLYKKLALQSYLRGLNEPLGSRIRCMRPDSLEDALKFAQEELNVIYLLSKNRAPTKSATPFTTPMIMPQPFRSVPVSPNLYPQSNSFNPFYQPMHGTVPLTPSIHNNFNPGPIPGPSRTQQVFKALPRSNMSTGFRIPPRPQVFHQNSYTNKTNPPQSMSGISHPVARTLPPLKRDYQPRDNAYTYSNFKPREMNMNELYNPYCDQSYVVYPYAYETPYLNCNYQPEYTVTHPNDCPPETEYVFEQYPDSCNNPDQENSEENFQLVPKDNAPE